MSSGAVLDIADPAAAECPTVSKGLMGESAVEKLVGPNGEQYPTVQDWSTLRRVYGKVNWMIYIIGIVEMCERFAYYGTTAVCMYMTETTRNICADCIKSSISSSKTFPLKGHFHQPVLQVRMVKPALWVWVSRLLLGLFSSIHFSHM